MSQLVQALKTILRRLEYEASFIHEQTPPDVVMDKIIDAIREATEDAERQSVTKDLKDNL